MLAHLKNKERLCCCQGPVAYAHRQRSIALRAKTEQPLADLRLQNYHFKNQKSTIINRQSSIDNHQSDAGKNAGTVAGCLRVLGGELPNPVAYAHRQRYVALRAKTKQPLAGLRGEA